MLLPGRTHDENVEGSSFGTICANNMRENAVTNLQMIMCIVKTSGQQGSSDRAEAALRCLIKTREELIVSVLRNERISLLFWGDENKSLDTLHVSSNANIEILNLTFFVQQKKEKITHTMCFCVHHTLQSGSSPERTVRATGGSCYQLFARHRATWLRSSSF